MIKKYSRINLFYPPKMTVLPQQCSLIKFDPYKLLVYFLITREFDSAPAILMKHSYSIHRDQELREGERQVDREQILNAYLSTYLPCELF